MIVKRAGTKIITKNGRVSCECCQEPEVCINRSFGITGVPFGACQGIQYGLQTITRPAGVRPAPTPVPVRIRGTVDDDLYVDGMITQAGQFPFFSLGYTCNGAHPVTVDFTLTTDSFTIAAGDNFGVNTDYDLQICFEGEPLPPP